MKKEVIAHKNSKSPISEIFRTLRTNLQFMDVNKKMQVILITSTIPEEGKSWITANLAVTFAQAGKKVIIIDSDMRKGRQYAILGVSRKPGLSDLLSQEEVNEKDILLDYIQATEINNLHVMAAGTVPPNPSELLLSTQMLDLLENLRSLYDIIIIDGTPSELVTDSIILSRIADSTIIVTVHKYTKKEALKRVIRNIKNVDGNIAGIIINKEPVFAKKFGKKYYYYGKEEENKTEFKKVNTKGKNFKNHTNGMDKMRHIEELMRQDDELYEAEQRVRQANEEVNLNISQEEKANIMDQISQYMEQENNKE